MQGCYSQMVGCKVEVVFNVGNAHCSVEGVLRWLAGWHYIEQSSVYLRFQKYEVTRRADGMLVFIVK